MQAEGNGSVTSYAAHLKSPLWSHIKGDAAARSMGLCELCKAAASETHHVKYPKGYAKDNAENVLHVCSACHRRLHGMNQLITDRQLCGVEVVNYRNRPARLWVDERRWVWASWPVWAKHLVIPQPMESRVLASAVRAAGELQKRRGQPFQLPNPDNEQWFRWHAVRASLQIWHDAMRRRIPNGSNFTIDDAQLTQDERLLYANYVAICDWGDDLQEQALAGALTAKATPALPAAPQSTDRLQQAMVLLVGEQFQIREQMGEHDKRLAVVEAAVTRDPNEFIDAKSFVTECGLASDRLVGASRLTVQQWLGMRMAEIGAERGKPARTRIEGTSRVVEVGTYRRADLSAALHDLPRD